MLSRQNEIVEFSLVGISCVGSRRDLSCGDLAGAFQSYILMESNAFTDK